MNGSLPVLWFLTLSYIINDDTTRYVHVVYLEYQLLTNTKTSCDCSRKLVVQRARKAKTRMTWKQARLFQFALIKYLFPDQFSICGEINSRS